MPTYTFDDLSHTLRSSAERRTHDFKKRLQIRKVIVYVPNDVSALLMNHRKGMASIYRL